MKLCLESVEKMIGEPITSEIHAPLVPGDHPELDDSAEVNDDKRQQYQSMIGMLQWAVTLGRIDIACAVMTMSRFRVAPREGHFKRVVRIFCFLRTYKKTGIKFLTEMPADYAMFNVEQHDWWSVYGPVHDLNAPWNA